MPVNREGGYSVISTAPPVPRTPAEQQERITALRNQIGHPEVMDATLRYSLMNASVNWDVNRAARKFTFSLEDFARLTKLRRALLGK